MLPSILKTRALVASCCALLLFGGCTTLPQQAVHDYSVMDRVTIGGPGGWDFIAFDSARARLFISRGDRVIVWSPDSRKVVGEIRGTEGVHGIALAQDLNRGFTTNGRANTISVFALDNLGVTDTIAVPGSNPNAILYEPAFKRVYSFNGRSSDVTVIDAVNLKVLTTIPLGGKPEVAVSDGAGHVFVNIEDTSEVVVIDQATNKIQARWPLGSCTEPTGLAIDKAHQRLFAVCANQEMTVVDSTAGRLVAHLAIGSEPDGVEFDPALGLAFSSNGDGTLTLVHEDEAEHFSVVANVPTQAKARTLALDPLSHRIFLVTAAFGPTPEPTNENPRARPPMVPDSFTVLVASPK